MAVQRYKRRGVRARPARASALGLSSTIAITLTVTLALDAGAETVDPAVVVVSAVKRDPKPGDTGAVDTKLQHAGIVDVVGADDVKSLPDTTIVDALRRVPGLSVLPTSDSEHARDEAASPVIRGLGAAYNNVTIDGSPLASAGTSNGNQRSIARGARLDILPASMIGDIVVNKTFSAALDPNAIGGAIDLRTRSAFARGGRPFFTIEGAGGGASDVSTPLPQQRIGARLVASGGLTFGPERRYGVVVAANHQRLDTTSDAHMTTDTVSENFYDSQGRRTSGSGSGNGIGNGYAVPQQDKYWCVQNTRSRDGITVKAEARPTDSVSAFVTGGYYSFQDHMLRHENLIDPRNSAKVFNQTATSGAYPGGAVEVGYSRQQMRSITRMLQTGLDWELAADQSLGLRANVSRATYREPIVMIKYVTNASYGAPGKAGATAVATPEYGFDYDTSGLNPSFNVAPSAWNKLDNYKLSYYRPDYQRASVDTIGNLRADYAFNAGKRGFGAGAGIAYTVDRPSYSIYRYELAPNNSQPALTLPSVIGPGAPLMYQQNGLGLLTIDAARAIAQMAALRSAGGFNVTDQANLSNQDNFEHRERTVGAYAQLDYTGDRLRARVGLREDATRQDTVGRALVAGSWTSQPSSSRYRFLLPSALATYRVSDAVDVRVAASQTIGRPTYDAYAARSAINFVNAADAGNADASGVTVVVGNPDIRPRRSTNTDLAFNYRLPAATGGLLSLAAFNKNIKDEIFDSSSLGYTYQGVTYANAFVTRPVNAAEASVRGVEASAIVDSLAWLHPLLADIGLSANWTAMRGSMDVLKSDRSIRTLRNLVGQPERTANLNIFYRRENLELRAAYQRQGKALRAIVPDIAWQDLYWASRAQLDFQASYRISPSLTFFGQVSNARASRMTSYIGPGQNLLKDTFSVPTVVWLGVRYTPALF
jgi:TonB-dependent receptor